MAIQHYTGSCQCGAVAFEADVDLEQTIVCNCSRCRRLGAVLAFTPREGGFRLKSGEERLKEYRFATGRIQHLFCDVCGIQGFAYGTAPDGTAMAAVNVNCLDDVDARALNPRPVDGRSS